MKQLLSIFFFFFYFALQAARPFITAGPMAGHISENSAKIWVMVKNASVVSAALYDAGSGIKAAAIDMKVDSGFRYKKQVPISLLFENLPSGSKFKLKIELDGVEQKLDFLLTTLQSETSRDFSFILGSCAMIFPKYLWLFFPKNNGKIFVPMKYENADFMLWLGDNVYFRRREHRSLNGMFKRHIIERRRKRMSEFMKSMPQYAIWDDHDFGPNDSEGSFPLKENSCLVQKNFWANPSCEGSRGVYTHFRHYDAEFILTDNRYFRTLPEDSNATLLGKDQLQWMFSVLKNSDATFKFIVTGSQVLNEKNLNESYSHYPAEREQILNFIKQNNISGVIFLTGDRHHSELLKMNHPGNYPFYDFTCSPLSGFARPTYNTHESTNLLRVENTLITEHNFGKISITGSAGNRKCVIETFDDKTNKIWEYIIDGKELMNK